MDSPGFWSRFAIEERRGVKLTLTLFVFVVIACTLAGGVAPGRAKAALDVFVASVGAFGQVSIAAGLYLLTRHQVQEARNAVAQAKSSADADDARHRDALERATRDRRQAAWKDAALWINALEDAAGRIAKARGATPPGDAAAELTRLTVALASSPAGAGLEAELTKLREIGQRLCGPAPGPHDRYTFGRTRKTLLAALRAANPQP